MPADLAAAVTPAIKPLGINGIHHLPQGKVVLKFSGQHAARTVDIERQPDISREEWAKITVWYGRNPKVEDRRNLRVGGLGPALVDLLTRLEQRRQRKRP